jgi:hypothetical protein
VILTGATIGLLTTGWNVWRSSPRYEPWVQSALAGTDGIDPGLGAGLTMIFAEGTPLYWAVAVAGLVAAYLSLSVWLPPARRRRRLAPLAMLVGLSALLAVQAGRGVSEDFQWGAEIYGAGKVLLCACGVWLTGGFAEACLPRRRT